MVSRISFESFLFRSEMFPAICYGVFVTIYFVLACKSKDISSRFPRTQPVRFVF